MNYCGASEAKCHIGITLSVHLSVCPAICNALLLLAPLAFRGTLVLLKMILYRYLIECFSDGIMKAVGGDHFPVAMSLKVGHLNIPLLNRLRVPLFCLGPV